MLNRRLIADKLKEAAAYHFFRYGYSISYELGIQSWGRRRVDVIGNKISGDIVICEVKSSVEDFRSDNKLQEYLPYSDRTYLVFTREVARKVCQNPELKAKVPKGVGVLVLWDDGYCRVVKPARRIEVKPDLRLSILARLAWRAGDLSKRIQRQRVRVFLDEESKNVFLSTPKVRKVKRRSRRRRHRSR